MFKTVGDLIKALQKFPLTAEVQADNKAIQNVSVPSGSIAEPSQLYKFRRLLRVDSKSRREAASEIQAFDVSRTFHEKKKSLTTL